MSISFNQIPINLLTPGRYIEFDNTGAVKGTPAMPHKALVIGQLKTSGSGTVDKEVPTLVPSGDAAEKYWLRGSQIASMCDAYKTADPLTELWGVALEDDAAGVAATADPGLVITGPATADGTIHLYIAGLAAKTAVADGDAQNDIATAVTAAVNAVTNLPVTAAVGGNPNEVDFTCNWKGITGNSIDIRLNHYQGEELPAGVAVNIGATAGTVDSTNNAPYNLEPDQTLLAKTDGGGELTATFTATKATLTGTGGAWATMASETMEVQVDTGDIQTVTFGTEATQALAIQLMNDQLTGCHVEAVDANNVKIIGDTRGLDSRIRTTNVAAGITTKLGLANDADESGTGNVGNIDAVTHAYAKTVIEAAMAALTYTPVSGSGTVATLTSNTTGASSSIEVTGGTARTIFGFPTGVNSGTGLSSAVLSGGSGNPDYDLALIAIGDEQYHTVALGVVDTANLGKIDTELASRWGPMVQKDGQAFAGARGTQGELTAIGNAENSPHVTIMGAGKSPSVPWIWASVVAAIDATETQIDPARPRQTLGVPVVKAPALIDIFTRAERNILLSDGVSTYTVSPSGDVQAERLITTYQLNPLSVPDTSYMDIATVRTLAYLRYSINARMTLRFPRHKLADDGTNFDPGQAIVTPSMLRNQLVALFIEWESSGLVENFAQFKDQLLVERNGTDPNRVDALIPPDLINQFRVFAAQIQYLL